MEAPWVGLAFTATCLWAVSAPLDKEAVLHSSPLSYALLLNLGLVLVYSGFLRKGLPPPSTAFKMMSWMAPVGFLGAWGLFNAMELLPISYVVSLKRLSVLFSLLWAWLIYRESVRERVVPAGLMLTGCVVIISTT